MYIYEVTIGRNVNGEPMSEYQFEQFVGDALLHLWELFQATKRTDAYGWDNPEYVATIERHNGIGLWEGKAEESTKLTLLSEYPMTHLNGFREQLSELARMYGQDAIALTIGESELC